MPRLPFIHVIDRSQTLKCDQLVCVLGNRQARDWFGTRKALNQDPISAERKIAEDGVERRIVCRALLKELINVAYLGVNLGNCEGISCNRKRSDALWT